MAPAGDAAALALNMKVVGELPACPLWTHFAQLAAIPRPSFKEGAVVAYLREFAKARALTMTEDETGNVCIFRKGTGAGAGAPSVCVQGHIDMVTEKNNDTDFDFETMGIRLLVENGTHLKADGTTLGADNGIGVAAALALLDAPETTSLPPIEALFTVAEEVGLQGAFHLDAKQLGLTAKKLINLDTEEWGSVYVGCAGGGDNIISLPVAREAADGATRHVELAVSGLRGGHSGVNINEYRGNANRLCMRALRRASEAGGVPVRVVSVDGGDKRNAIPRECRAVLAIKDDGELAALKAAVAGAAEVFRREYGVVETNLAVALNELDGAPAPSAPPLAPASFDALLTVCLALPDGPIKFSSAMPELVETSSTMAIVKLPADAEQASIGCSTRSSLDDSLADVRSMIKLLVQASGGSVDQPPAYPGWAPDLNSSVLALARGEMAKAIGADVSTVPCKAIHAGLECGVLQEKMAGDVDMVSYGPTITGAHSPDERLQLDTVPPFWDVTLSVMERLAECKA